ncbi:MAG: hypothetical protein IPM46_08055 [Flavobacteriales bacterium]|nr:hypothetical protein [Flavobacteriales bacterium]
MGAFVDPASGEEVVYFANTGTYKLIRFFDREGGLVKETSLKRIRGDVARVEAWSLDSVLAIHLYTNWATLVVNDSVPVREIQLDSVLHAKTTDRFELWPSPFSCVMNDGSLILHPSWAANLRDQDEAAEPAEGTYEYFNYYCRQSASRPAIVKFNPAMSPQSATFMADSFYSKLSDRVSLYDETAPYAVCNNRIFMMTFYSPHVLVLDATSGQVMDTLTLSSSVTQVHIPPPTLTEEEFGDVGGRRKERLRTGACIQGIAFDKPLQRYVVVIAHQVSLSDSIPSGLRPFSVLAYDTLFNRMGEIVIEGGEYVMQNMLSLSDGVYLMRWRGGKESAHGRFEFQRIAMDTIE